MASTRSVDNNASAKTAESSAVKPPQPPPAGQVRQLGARMTFVGDLALTMQIGAELRAAYRPNATAKLHPDYPFEPVAARLRESTLLVGNLECVMSELGSLATEHNPFRCPREALKPLRAVGFDLLSVANNHSMDFGRRGFDDMIATLDEERMQHIGKDAFSHRLQEPVVRELAGHKVGLLAYYYPPNPPLRDVISARPQVDLLVVFNHWGQEGQPEPMILQRRLGRAFIDAGVDLVVGTHAHVLQPVEWYRGKLIAYGLGNFVFNGMNDTELHRIGAMLEVDIDEGGLAAHRLLKIRLDDRGIPNFVDDPGKAQPLRETAKPLR